MMKRLMMAVVAASFAAPAWGEDLRERFARKYGEAMAIAEICPTLAINSTRMTAYMMAAGLELDGGMELLIGANRLKAQSDLSGRSETDVCLVGTMLYGPEGSNGPHLLKKE